jgi:hypothetical protein
MGMANKQRRRVGSVPAGSFVPPPASSGIKWKPSTTPSSKGSEDADWREFRDAYLKEFSICCWPGCGGRATEVHHIKSPRTHPHRRLLRSNVRGYCNAHHSSITASE